MGRRTAAWVIDFALYWIAAIVLFTQLAVQFDPPPGQLGVSCQQLQDAAVTNVCVDWNDSVIFLDDDSDNAVMSLFALGWFVVIYVLLQGATGATPGKLLMGVRVVDQQGRPCGMVKSLVRSLLWVVDAAPWIIPGLVGFITGLTSTGHRRVGDMAASTYVVAKASVGTPITVGGQGGIPNHPPSGPQSAYGNAWSPNPEMPVTDWGPPQGPPGTDPNPPSVWGPPSEPVPPSGPAPEPASPPWGPTGSVPSSDGWGTPPLSSQPEPQPAASPEPEPAPAGELEPKWDPVRNTYIVWDPRRGAWLQWDDTTQQWGPI